MIRFEGKIAIVTGGRSGIGQAIARRLRDEGARVFTAQRGEDHEFEHVGADFSDPHCPSQVVGEVIEQAGQLDVLINNAGIGGGVALEETPMDDLRHMMETNFFGPIDLMQRVVPEMRERGSGAILNVTSMNGLVALAPMMSYTASKYALEAATEVLAMEMKGFGVRVALIEPGVVMTPIFEKLSGLVKTADHSS